MNGFTTLVFDLDGTLVDTAGDLTATLNVVLDGEGCAPLPLAETRAMIGHGARALLRRGLEARGLPFDEGRLDALFVRFLAHYEANIAVLSRPLPGLTEALDALEAKGFRFAVLTNKLEGLSRRLLAELGLLPRFTPVIGGDTYPFRKPDPRIFVDTVRGAGGDPARAIMIGDSATDLDTGRAAGAPVILVDFGYTEIPARELGADIVISAWAELPAAVDRLVGRFDLGARAAL